MARTIYPIRTMSWLFMLCIAQLFIHQALAEECTGEADGKVSVQDWVKDVRSSVVNVKSYDMEGKLLNSASGFVLASDGKIATHLSALRKSSMLKVEFEDGRTHEVSSIHASDEIVDLAILKIKGNGYRPLKFGDVDFVDVEDLAVGLGYSMGIEDRVIKGKFLEREESEGIEKFMVDFSAEDGYLGGPIFNKEGEVVGVLGEKVNKKSSYAIQVNNLKTLLEAPNPMSMKAWIKQGKLDNKYWKPIFGAQWLDKRGMIHVSDAGNGFGGRALCLWQQPKPKGSLELSVSVKMKDESGAAGLVFHSDGSEKHYAFYPSNGQMRLTYFGGPNVYSWEIIEEVKSSDYHLGEWNQLKVTLEEGRINCFVNDKLVIQSNHQKRMKGRVGLAKFRDTSARFKNFKVAKYAFKEVTQQDRMDELNDMVEGLPSFSDLMQEDINQFSKHEELTRLVLAEKQKRLEKELEQTKKLMQEIHIRNVAREMNDVLDDAESEIDLWKLALLVAKLDDRTLDIDYYLDKMDKMAAELKRGTRNFNDLELKQKLDRFLFTEQGYHGARFDYYKKQNSYVNRVLEDRKGIPLTLSILYMELGKRLGLDLQGVGLPGHFVVKLEQTDEDPMYIDVFGAGKVLERPDLEEIVSEHSKEGLKDEYLFSMSKKQMARRMLSNLLVIAENDSDKEAMLRYLATEVTIIPELINERVMLSVMYYESGRQLAAEEQLRYLLNGNIRLEDIRKIEDMLVYMMNHPKS